MTHDDLIGRWKLTGFGPMPVPHSHIMELRNDGSVITLTNGTEESATWQYVDATHWNLRCVIPADPNTPGLENGAIDISEYEIIASSKDRIELMIFDYEFPFIYERES